MKIKQITALTLLCATLLAACSPASPAPVTTESGEDLTSPPVGTESAEVTTAAEPEITPDIPEITYDGEEFRIMYRFGAHAYNIKDIWVESTIGEIINDAVYERNLAVEDKFNLKIIPMPEASPVAHLQKNVGAGDDFCEILADRKIELFPLTMTDHAYDLTQLQYIDFEKPWWDKNAAEQLEMGGRLYMMIGDFNLSSTSGATFLWFNKKILEDNNLTFPYETVSEGKWTLDLMREMVQTVSYDLNGDGAMSAGDRFGFLTQVPYRLLCGFGVRLTSRDEDGYPVLNDPDDRMIRGIETVASLLNDKEHTISYDELAEGQNTSGYPHIYAYGRSKFAADQILFFEGSISAADEFREMESPYGIAPMPKLDETQDRYYNLVDEYANGWVIPNSSRKTAMTDVVLEYMSYKSDKLVDAVYETTLKLKRMNAPEDAAMLDLIRQTTHYEITFVMNIGIREMLQSAVASGDVASTFQRSGRIIRKKMDQFRKTDA